MKGKTILGVIIVFVILAGASAAYVLRPTPEASQPIEALPIDDMSSDAEKPVEEMDAEDTQSESMDETSEGDEMMSSGALVFTISQEESQVSFTLDEDLRDVPTTVVGTTNQVAGQAQVDMGTSSASQVGVISINARTLATDSEFRNRAINNEILDVADYEFITFTPTSISGMPDTMSAGESYELQITGNLSVRDVTRSETFDVTITLVSHSRLEGQGETTILRSDYGLTIPSVPHVANVTDEVVLAIDFVAVAE